MSETQNAAQEMLIAEFRAIWAKRVSELTLGAHESEEEGVHFKGRLRDPFSGTISGNAYFSWREIIGAISGKEDLQMLKEEAAASICLGGDPDEYGSPSELVMDSDGRVHSASDLEDL